MERYSTRNGNMFPINAPAAAAAWFVIAARPPREEIYWMALAFQGRRGRHQAGCRPPCVDWFSN